MNDFPELSVTRPICLDVSPVRFDPTGDKLAPVWWRGGQWAVTARGIEKLDGTFSIPVPQILIYSDTFPYPLFMADKRWVDLDEFVTCWMVAIMLHDLKDRISSSAVRSIFNRLPLPRPEDGTDDYVDENIED